MPDTDTGQAAQPPSFVIKPKVDQAREFIEIASDFSNPLEIVREAISNSYDADATTIKILFDVLMIAGEWTLRIVIEDDGEGMDRDALQAFFDLGNSPRRAQREQDPEADLIGEKGHGTKIFFNSAKITVRTCAGAPHLELDAVVEKPLACLYEGAVPDVPVTESNPPEGWHGTIITIDGYNHNRCERFSHQELKDYVLWFTRFGSVQRELTGQADPTVLHLKGVGEKEPEKLEAGHRFPEESPDRDTLFDLHQAQAPDHFARRWKREGALPHFPYIRYQASFWVEGDAVKKEYNPMIRRQGKTPPAGAYAVQDRYGLWLCRDFMPIQRSNEWITTKGREFTPFHAFFNCDTFSLTANRGSVDNTPAEMLQAMQEVCRGLYEEILSSDDWSMLEFLREEATGYVSEQKEQKSLEQRLRHLKTAYRGAHKDLQIFAPRNEAGVYSVFLQLSTVEPDLFPFRVLDYDTHQGLDVIAEPLDSTSMADTQHRYVEFKYALSKTFNHTFKHLHAVVCWELGCQVDGEVADARGKTRVLKEAVGDDGMTRYFLDDSMSGRRIEVIALPEFLGKRLGLTFAKPPP